MIDKNSVLGDQLNSYNVAQLQFALGDTKNEEIPFIHDLSPSPIIPQDTELDYEDRRMSSSATSAADTDTSSILSGRPEKHPIDSSAHNSPQPKKQRPDWDGDSPSSVAVDDKTTSSDGLDQKVQLPSIFTTFEDTHRGELRRASLPTLHSESRIRHAPYPSPSLRHQPYAPSTQSSLASYTFPPTNEESSPADKNRPRLSTDVEYGMASYDSPYPPTTSTTTPASSSGFSSYGLSPYSESESWNGSPSGIVRPNSTPGQLSSPGVKYEDGLRHSFSAGMSQAQQMFAGSARISGHHDRRSLSSAGLKTEWSFPDHNFVLPSATGPYPPGSMPPAPSMSTSPSRTSPTVPPSSLVDRPQRKRGKLPKETTDFLKAWLHRHSDHPYPSEEEKKQLCHATGLSMSQVSNWMINARRRILAPVRPQSGPTTTSPYPPTRGMPPSHLLDQRRASLPATHDGLHLYHPMSLQSLPPSSHHPSDYMRLGLSRPPHQHQMGPGSGLDYPSSRAPMLSYGSMPPGGSSYAGGGGSGGGGGSVPMSAPPTMSGNPFSTPPQTYSGPSYPFSDGTAPGAPAGSNGGGSNTSGSGYGTPQ